MIEIISAAHVVYGIEKSLYQDSIISERIIEDGLIYAIEKDTREIGDNDRFIDFEIEVMEKKFMLEAKFVLNGNIYIISELEKVS